jgi:urocanate hydratase
LAKANKETVSIGYLGNIVDVWEKFDEKTSILIWEATKLPAQSLGWGILPCRLSFEEANEMMANDPDLFKRKVQETLRRHTTIINKHTAKGTYFFDYGNAFLEASRAGADIMAENHIDFSIQATFKTSWDPCVLILVLVLSVGFASGNQKIYKTDAIACAVLEEMAKSTLLKFSNKCNISMDKGHKKINWSLAHKPEFYMQMLKAG